ncbi:MAG: PQQ-binding-like beta-propeller repeat protein [Polyangiaceae bacterium]|nr:PQQ-binding-like beta-propeller repeat protein [Polyangiaceae bacterium]
MTRLTKSRAAAGLGALLAAACGSAPPPGSVPFSPEWSSDDGRSIAALWRRLARVPPAAEPDLVVGTTSSGVVGRPLGGGAKWKLDARLEARPALAGGRVIVAAGGRLSAIDARTGRRLWARPSPGGAMVAAAGDAQHVVVVLRAARPGRSVALALDAHGEPVHRWEIGGPAGQPAVHGGVAFIPWAGQYVSALDLATGAEVARLLLREQVSHALLSGGALWFGERSLVRFDDRIGAATRGGATTARLTDRALPGAPAWLGDGTRALPVAPLATDRVRLSARPSGAGFEPAVAVATYHRLVLGIAPTDGALRFVTVTPAPLLDVAAAEGGFALCASDGAVRWVGQRGALSEGPTLAEPLLTCEIHASAAAAPAAAPAATLPEQLAEAIRARETDLVVGQRFLLGELAKLPGPAVTRAVLDVAADPRVSPDLAGVADSVLAARRDGADVMLEALSRSYDFLSDERRPPPVGPLAEALAAIGDPRAAAPLARHLNDPATPLEALERCARALETLATPAETEALLQFFSLYRAAAEQPEIVRAVVSVARTLRRVGGAEGRRAVKAALRDPLTQPEVAAALGADDEGAAPTPG